MEESKVPRKYAKSEAIWLYSFWFFCTTFIVTGFTGKGLSYTLGILPKHIILHVLFQGLIYVLFYKMCKSTISKGVTANSNPYGSDGFNMSKSISGDMNCCSDPRDSMNSNSLTSTQYRILRDGF